MNSGQLLGAPRGWPLSFGAVLLPGTVGFCLREGLDPLSAAYSVAITIAQGLAISTRWERGIISQAAGTPDGGCCEQLTVRSDTSAVVVMRQAREFIGNPSWNGAASNHYCLAGGARFLLFRCQARVAMNQLRRGMYIW